MSEIEQATVTVLVSPELVRQLSDGWSEPVQIRITETPTGPATHEMEVRSVPDKSHYGVPCATCGSVTDDHDAMAHDTVRTSDECVHHNAGYVADVEGRIHLLDAKHARMACGRKIGEHYGSALNAEYVNCPDCLATMQHSPDYVAPGPWPGEHHDSDPDA
jgi:hypothetical protein